MRFPEHQLRGVSSRVLHCPCSPPDSCRILHFTQRVPLPWRPQRERGFCPLGSLYPKVEDYVFNLLRLQWYSKSGWLMINRNASWDVSFVPLQRASVWEFSEQSCISNTDRASYFKLFKRVIYVFYNNLAFMTIFFAAVPLRFQCKCPLCMWNEI